MCAVLAVILYMTEKKRFLYGINGAGDPLINILVFVLLMQSTIGLINGTGMFESGATVASPADCANGSVTFTNCAINGNLMLTNIQNSSGTNNVLGQTFSAVLTIASMGWNLLVLIVQLLVSVSVFGVVIYNTYPWIASSPLAMVLLGLLQLGIWLIYMLTLFRYVFKTMPQDGRM
jgi:magnesium-transporting ATPase (P-type)